MHYVNTGCRFFQAGGTKLERFLTMNQHYGIPGCGVFQGRDTKLERFLANNQLYSNEITKF